MEKREKGATEGRGLIHNYDEGRQQRVAPYIGGEKSVVFAGEGEEEVDARERLWVLKNKQ